MISKHLFGYKTITIGYLQTLANAAIYGVAIGLALALPILILTTQNVIIGVMATLTIGCVTVCVIGMIPMAGWRLGVSALQSTSSSFFFCLFYLYLTPWSRTLHISECQEETIDSRQALDKSVDLNPKLVQRECENDTFSDYVAQ